MITKTLILTFLSTFFMEEAFSTLHIDGVELHKVNTKYLSPDFDIRVENSNNSSKRLYINMTVVEDFPYNSKFLTIVDKLQYQKDPERINSFFSIICDVDENYGRLPAYIKKLTDNDLECIRQQGEQIFPDAGIYDFEKEIPNKEPYFIKNTNQILTNGTVILHYDLFIRHEPKKLQRKVKGRPKALIVINMNDY